MKLQEVQATIPLALQELHDRGFDQVYVDQLGQQVTRHDEKYLRRRGFLRKFAGRLGITMPELPHGHSRPGAYKMYRSLGRLELAGVVAGEFETPPDENGRARRKYYLVEREVQSDGISTMTDPKQLLWEQAVTDEDHATANELSPRRAITTDPNETVLADPLSTQPPAIAIDEGLNGGLKPLWP